MPDPIIDIEKLDILISKLKVLTHPDRILIIDLLRKQGQVSVGEIQSYLNLDFVPTSVHLRLLKAQHILIQKRAGSYMFYSINHSVLNGLIECINSWE